METIKKINELIASKTDELNKPKWFGFKYFLTSIMKNSWMLLGIIIFAIFVPMDMDNSFYIVSGYLLPLTLFAVGIISAIPTFENKFTFDIFKINNYMEQMIELVILKKYLIQYERTQQTQNKIKEFINQKLKK